MKKLLLLIMIFVFGLFFWSRSFYERSPLAREQIFAAYVESGRLDFRFFSQVSWVADFFTFGTPYGHRYSVNHLSDAPGNIAILIVNTQADQNETASLPFYRQIKHQCAALPSQRLVLCDATLLDSIPSDVPIAGAAPDRPQLLFQWLIGHELAHILLEHGSDKSGALAFSFVPDNAIKTPHGEPASPSKSALSCQGTASAPEGSLFELEAQADRFVVDMLRADTSVGLTLYRGGMAQLALWLTNEEERRQKISSSNPIEVSYQTDRHPPFLYRIVSFFTEAERIYPEIDYPLFVRRLDKFCLRPGSAKLGPKMYFFGDSYIEVAPEASLEHDYVKFLQKAQRIARTGRTSKQNEIEGKPWDWTALCNGPSESACLGKVIDQMITVGRCPSRVQLNDILEDAAARSDTASPWVRYVLSYQQLVQSIHCVGKNDLELPDVFYSLERLMSSQSSALTAVSIDPIIAIIGEEPARIDRINSYVALSQLVFRFAWHDEAARLLNLAASEVDQEDLQEALAGLDLTYRSALFRGRGSAWSNEQRVSAHMEVVDQALLLTRQHELKDAQLKDFVDERVAQSLSSAVFILHNSGQFDDAIDLQVRTLLRLEGLITISDNAKAMLVANEAAANASTATPMRADFFSDAMSKILRRAEAAVEEGNISAVADASQGFVSLAAWAFVVHDDVRRAAAAEQLKRFYPGDPEKTIEARFENLSTIADGRKVNLLDVIRGGNYRPENYDVWSPLETVEWRWSKADR